MHSQSLQCLICFQDFDVKEHVPKILPNCGHTICLECLKGLLASRVPKCPFDKKSFSNIYDLESFPSNFALKDLIEETLKWEICKVHGERMKLACFTDKRKVCAYCILYDGHKDHHLKPIEDFNKEIEEKMKKMEIFLENLEKHYGFIDNTLETARINLLKETDMKFSQIIAILTKKKAEIKNELDLTFKQQRKKLASVIGKESFLRTSLNEKVTFYKKFLNEKQIFQLTEEDFKPFTTNFDEASANKQFKGLMDKLSYMTANYREFIDVQLDILAHPDTLSKEIVNQFRNLDQEDNFLSPVCQLSSVFSLFNFQSCLEIIYQNNSLEIRATNRKPKLLELRSEEWKAATEVTFKMDKFGFAFEDLNVIEYIWSNLGQIQALRVFADWQSAIQDHNLVNLFAKIFSKPQRLQEISVSFCLSKVGDPSIVFLCEKVFPKVESLKILKLDLWQTHITASSIQALAKVIPYFKELKIFKLNLNKTQIPEDVIARLFINIPTVTSYELHLVSSNIGDKGLELLVANALPKMKSLESLEIRLKDTNITDQSVIKLFENINQVKSVKLGLEATKITHKSIETLINIRNSSVWAVEDFEIYLSNASVTTNLKVQFDQRNFTLKNIKFI